MIEVSREIQGLDDNQVLQRILQIKKKRGPSLMILGHHYQRASIISIADKIGDSFGLAKAAAEARQVKDIVFCGVRFMAESAAVLCRDDQRVLHPEPEAGCAMANMAPMSSVEYAWEHLHGRSDMRGVRILPITYMNSHAPLKAFTGKHGGAVCTSSNAKQVMQWAFERADKVLFFPDEKLGRNTGYQMGISDEEMCVWYPSKKDGGLPSLKDKKVILWNGHCPVHMKFTVRDIDWVRKHFPQAKVVVHPECDQDVVQLADAVGSTTYIAKWVSELPAKSTVFIGTELNLVERLKMENPHIRVEALFRSLCPTMYMVDLKKVLHCLEHIEETEPVIMSQSIKEQARLALQRMLDLQGFVG